jgi:hypothetical protein
MHFWRHGSSNTLPDSQGPNAMSKQVDPYNQQTNPDEEPRLNIEEPKCIVFGSDGGELGW